MSIFPGLYTNLEKLILASGSARRSQMLLEAGIQFEKKVSDIEEEVLPGETAEKMVVRLSEAKGQAVALLNPEDWVLSADTTVVIDELILNKPIDFNDSVKMLSKLQGDTHFVLGGITITNIEKGISETHLVKSKVWMKKLSMESIHNYIKTNEPNDKAGSYAIQGIGASFIERIEGSYTNVVGMDLSLVVDLLLKHKVIK